MKTRLLSTLILSVLFVCCERTEQPALHSPEGEMVTIRAIIPDADPAVKGASTKTQLSWTWNAGDKITVIGETTEVFTIKDGFTPKVAEFEGVAVKGSKFTILYPGESVSTTDWSAQTQVGNNNLDHLRYEASLNDVDNYTEFSFSPEWAAAHGGTLKQIGVAKFSITLPDGITDPETLSLSADEPIFYSGNGDEKTDRLSLTLSGCAVTNGILTTWMVTSWNEVALANGTNLYVGLTGNGKIVSRTIVLTKDSAIGTGVVNTFTIPSGGWADETQNLHYAGGKGTSTSPWIIETEEQLRYVAGDLLEDVVRYYKLNADIDLTGKAEWVPLNNASPYSKGIDFDGNGKTIKGLTITSDVAYPSFAGVLYGSIKNLTLDAADINGNANNTGVVAGYIGTGSYDGSCSGVTVSNATITGTGKNVGGFAGVVGTAGSSISNCHVTGTTTVSQTATATGSNAGGFIGNVNALATITGCTAKADVSNNASYYTGGFIGQMATIALQVSDCAFLGGTITAGRSNNNSPVGGFIGRIPNGAGASFTNCYVDGAIINAPKSGRVGGFIGDAGNNATTKNSFTSCHVVNSSISGGMNTGGFAGTYGDASKCYVDNTTVTAGNAQAGGFVGYPEGSTIRNCYASSTVTVNGGTQNNVGGFLGICKGNATIECCYEASSVTGTGSGTGAFIGIVDAAPISITKCIAWNGTLNFYGALKSGVSDSAITGNYAGTEGTISSQATALGWSTDIWDLSGDAPKLK